MSLAFVLRLDNKKKFLRKSDNALAWAAQRSGVVTIPGSVPELQRCGTEERGLVGTAVMGWWLYEVISGVFSNHNDFMNL